MSYVYRHDNCRTFWEMIAVTVLTLQCTSTLHTLSSLFNCNNVTCIYIHTCKYIHTYKYIYIYIWRLIVEEAKAHPGMFYVYSDTSANE